MTAHGYFLLLLRTLRVWRAYPPRA